MDRWRCHILLDDQIFRWTDAWQGRGSNLCLNSWWTQLILHIRVVRMRLRPQHYDPWIPTPLHPCFTRTWCCMLHKNEGKMETSHHWFRGAALGQSHKGRLHRAIWQGLLNGIHQGDNWGHILCDGVYPFDCSVITKKQMWPSEATSVKGLFTVKYTSPVQAIITAFQSHQPTTFKISPSHAHPPIPPPLVAEPGPSLLELDTPEYRYTSPHITHTPQSSPKRPYQVINPTLLIPETPSKCMQMMTAGFTGTQTGSFLISHAEHTPSTPFP